MFQAYNIFVLKIILFSLIKSNICVFFFVYSLFGDWYLVEISITLKFDLPIWFNLNLVMKTA
jgi:hypothetical protein